MSSVETNNIDIKDIKYQKYLPKDFKSPNPIRLAVRRVCHIT